MELTRRDVSDSSLAGILCVIRDTRLKCGSERSEEYTAYVMKCEVVDVRIREQGYQHSFPAQR
ncbi:hypothetical protein O3P69_020246 [Scylla paramamosain]|uniref:Uncharacterized protein n=1 Tax=Scylla paramamosain TaxID=85552 RepID=A0AAW0TL63_SCYPA